MGNQSSRIIDKTKRTSNRPKGRRRSTISHRSAPATINFRPDRRPSAAGLMAANTPHHVKRRKPSSVKSPEDLREWDRLQRQHYLLKNARSTNCCAIDKMDYVPKTILDIDTGNGIWAFEMAIEHPSCQVIGLGQRSVPDQNGRPSNLEYIQADIHQSWALASNSVDLIFQRAMGPTLTTKQWDHILAENIRVLKPGGYIEWVECDVGHHRPGPIQQAFDQYIEQEWIAKAMDFNYTTTFDAFITKQLELKNHMTWDIPIGEWHDEIHGKQLGFINQDLQKASYRNKKPYYTTAWNMTSDDYDAAVQELLLEFEDYKSFSRFHCWLARKPSSPTSP